MTITFLVTTPPGARTAEALRAAISTAAAGHTVNIAFIGDGILAAIRTVPLPDLASCAAFAELESLGAGLVHPRIMPVMRPALLELLSDSDQVLGF